MERLEEYFRQQGEFAATDARLLRDVAYERLHHALKYAGLRPGDVLSETRLSKALNISRTPTREALQQLANEGLIQVIPGRAITVAAPSIKEILDALHVRELLEPEIARTVAEAISDDEKKALHEITMELEIHALNKSRQDWLKTDIKWHEILNNACPNRLLGQFVLQARNRVYSQGVADHITDQDIIDGTLEHKQVVEAILSGDGDAAQRIMLSHLKRVGQNMFRRLGSD
jgi:DNA-binding GntR family transcriptional regulator